MILKDRTTTKDVRLDRLVQYDEASREYPIRTLVAEKPLRSYTWRLNDYLDQGREGACVGFAFSHELIARPVESNGIDAQFARNVYHEAQKIDPWEGGAYPGADPHYEGTSILAGAKHIKSLGHFSEYRWAFSLEDALRAIGYAGPGVLGARWYEGMMDADKDGYIRPTGNAIGGHAILVRGVDLKRERILLSNSWGKKWGLNGDCFMTFGDFEALLKNQGEFCIPIGRRR